MNDITTNGFAEPGAAMFWLHLHWFFGAFAIVGFILLTVWAVKKLSDEKLKSFTIWLLVIGIVGTLLTAPLAFSGFQQMAYSWNGSYGNHMMINGVKMQNMMEMMMEHDEGNGDEEHREMEGMMQEMMSPRHDTGGNRGDMMNEAGNRPGMMMQ